MLHIHDQLYLTSQDEPPSSTDTKVFISLARSVPRYQPYCDDFGPMNLAAIYKFCALVDVETQRGPTRDIVVCAADEETRCNACFLVGAYLILRKNRNASEVCGCFEPVLAELLPYRDISPGPRNFDLRLQDCWEALEKSRDLTWVDFEDFDFEEYEHYDDPANGDLHAVIPGKLIAMKGPVDLPDDALWWDRPEGSRDFSPAYMAEVLEDFGVSAVVRLNEAVYDADGFRAAGIAVLKIPFDDCRSPPEDVVAKFLLLVESAPGAVAVHCKAGLGRTGTLIALHLMKSHGFTARQAMGWLRIVRPGSVIGEQQHYLCAMEAAIVRMRGRPAASPPPSPAAHATREGQLASMEALCSRICLGVERAMARPAAPPGEAARAAAGRWSSLPGQTASSPDMLGLEGAAGEGSAEALASHVTLVVGRRAQERKDRMSRMHSVP